jgi:hypothetical protein
VTFITFLMFHHMFQWTSISTINKAQKALCYKTSETISRLTARGVGCYLLMLTVRWRIDLFKQNWLVYSKKKCLIFCFWIVLRSRCLSYIWAGYYTQKNHTEIARRCRNHVFLACRSSMLTTTPKRLLLFLHVIINILMSNICIIS